MESSRQSEDEYTFKVMGNTGNAYNILVTRESISCSCPDWSNICKHMMHLLIRVSLLLLTNVFLLIKPFQGNWN